MIKEININHKWFYEFEKDKEQTRKRLQEIIDLGLKEVGNANFGIPDLMSGLYIEKVWYYSNKGWNEYIDWIKDLKKSKNKHNE